MRTRIHACCALAMMACTLARADERVTFARAGYRIGGCIWPGHRTGI